MVKVNYWGYDINSILQDSILKESKIKLDLLPLSINLGMLDKIAREQRTEKLIRNYLHVHSTPIEKQIQRLGN